VSYNDDPSMSDEDYEDMRHEDTYEAIGEAEDQFVAALVEIAKDYRWSAEEMYHWVSHRSIIAKLEDRL